jgi:3-oxoacyl-ACP reductase-like protein
MSVFGNIMSNIFGHAKAQAAPATPQQSTASSGNRTSGPAPASPPASGAKTAAAPDPTHVQVDVEAVLKDLASKNKEKLDWRNSIVDLMKLVNLDSSLPARKELAKELQYSGDTNDSAKMNIWLHKQVMIKLAENGGTVPDSLKA